MKRTYKKTLLGAALSAVIMAAGTAKAEEIRTWTSTVGTAIEAEMVGTDGLNVTLRMADGTEKVVALKQLSAEDQKFVAAEKAKFDSGIAKALDGKLVKLDGKRLKKTTLTEREGGAPKLYAIYFSAHWCVPCQKFTPSLVDFYDKNRKDHPELEVIFVSSDHSEDEMEAYMAEAKMPWLAVAYKDKKRADDIIKYAGAGIPCLVVVDAAGKVLSDSYDGETYVGPNKVMQDLEGFLKNGIPTVAKN